MSADEVPLLNLFDSFWFEQPILSIFSTKSHAAVTNTSTSASHLQAPEEPNPFGLPTLIVRSLSDQLFSDSSFSPNSVLPTATPMKLQTIPSGKEVLIEDFSRESHDDHVKQQVLLEVGSTKKKAVLHSERSKRRKTSGSSKSLSDLEFDELKGFMDLGFVFTEEDNKDSKLVSIIPGLQRLGLGLGDDGEHGHAYDDVVSRPYLSEAWEALKYQRKEDRLMNWRVPAANLDKEMKHHLKFWAHTVASTVR